MNHKSAYITEAIDINVIKSAGKIMRVLTPHHYERTDDIFGRNDMKKLFMDPAYDKKLWPDFKPMPLSNSYDPVEMFYKPLSERMIQEYFSYAFRKHGYKTYEEIKELPQFDISSLTENTSSILDIEFETDHSDRETAEQYGMSIFTPCMPEYVIRFGKWHLLYVKMLENKNGMYTVQFGDYLTEKKIITCIERFTVSYSYDYDKNDIQWVITDYTAYEDLLTADIEDIGWSEKQKQFWFDIFGVCPLDDPVIVLAPIASEINGETREEMNPFVIYRKKDAEQLVRESRKLMPLKIDYAENGKDFILKQEQKRMDVVYPNCLTALLQSLLLTFRL